MDIKKSGVWMTASESELLHKWSVPRQPALAFRIMKARERYVAEHPADPLAVDELLTNGVRAAILKSVGGERRERLIQAFLADMSLDAAKDEAGIEQAVVGPVMLSATELIAVRRLAQMAGDEAQSKLVRYAQEMAIPSSELDYLGREDQKSTESLLYPEVAAESLVASGIMHAIDVYFKEGQ